jgi:hypothetical protein
VTGFVIHDRGEPKSVASGIPPDPVPNGWSAKVITADEFAGLTGGTHRWDAPSRSVVVDVAKAQAAANQQAIRDFIAQALSGLQAIINTPPATFTTTPGVEAAMRALQAQVKDEARLLRRIVRFLLDDFTAPD